jgi:hypothetical protein
MLRFFRLAASISVQVFRSQHVRDKNNTWLREVRLPDTNIREHKSNLVPAVLRTSQPAATRNNMPMMGHESARISNR